MIQSLPIAVSLSLVPTLLTDAQIYAAAVHLHYPWPTSLKGERLPWSLSTAPLQTTNVFPPSTPSSHCTQSRLLLVSGSCFSVSSGLLVMHATWNTPHTMCYKTCQTDLDPLTICMACTMTYIPNGDDTWIWASWAVFPRWLRGHTCQTACWVKGQERVCLGM